MRSFQKMRKRSEFRLLFRSSPTSDMSALLFGALVAASAVLGAQALAAEAEGSFSTLSYVPPRLTYCSSS